MATTRFSNSSILNKSPKYVSMLAGNDAFIPSSFESIATISPSSASVSFTSIPDTYQHLQLRYIARVTATVTTANMTMTFNNDTGTNYAWHYLAGNGTSAVASAGTTANSIRGTDGATGASAAANIFGVGIIDIHDYASATKNKTVRWFSGQDRNGTGDIFLNSGFRASTDAINRIDITNTFASGSIFALYGIKGA